MNLKKFLAVAMSAMVVGGIATPAIVSNAEGLTQAANPDEVNYGIVTKSDITLLKSLFDLEYYMAENPDIVELVGADPEKLFEHFYKCGIFEGRTCNSSFDPAAYASAYTDLKDSFGLDILSYYRHYASVGLAENRNLTTLKECAKAGITVNTLSAEPVKITPQVYYLAKDMGTKDFKTVSAAVERAYVQQKMAVVETSTGTYVISSKKDVGKLKGFKAIGTIKAGDATLTYYVFDNSTGTAIYNHQNITSDSEAVFKTSDSVAVTASDYKGNIKLNVTSYSQQLSKTVEDKLTANESAEPYVTGSGVSGTYAKTLHLTDIENGDNVVSIQATPNTQNGASGSTSINRNIQNSSYDQYYVGGTVDGDGNKTANPYEYGTQEYKQWLSDNNIRNGSTDTNGLPTGQLGTMWVDTKGDASTEYTVCAGVEQVGNSKDITVGMYNEETGSYTYTSIQIPNSGQ